ncbi:MAG: hypothetical protein ACLFWL_12380 [Candidatus Brocadiia bacterium]
MGYIGIKRLLIAVVGSMIVFACPGWAASIWKEGEDARTSRVDKHPWYNSVKRDKLSGGDWLSHFGAKQGEAEYMLTITKRARYVLWVRANPTKARLRWRLDGGKWQNAPLDRARHRRNIAADGAPDLRFIGWVKIGTKTFAKGQHTLSFRFVSKNHNHGAIDVIYLTDTGREPAGKIRPEQAASRHEEGYFAWAPGVDPIMERGRDCPIDLRWLNESTAGVHGFVIREDDHLIVGSGKKVRFWAVQGGLGNTPDQFERRARRLAKYGVNLVRMGGDKFFETWRHDKKAFRQHLDQLHKKVASLKRNGIYTYLDHLYWHTHDKISKEIYPGFGSGKNAIALLFFSDKFQSVYLNFLEDLLTTNNPYTGRSMGKDSAVAFVEIQNESSLLFWTFKPSQFPATERELVEKKFGDWLKNKYGSLGKARRAWGANPRKGKLTDDVFAAGRVGLYSAGMLTGHRWARNGRNPRRATDQLQFMVESQKQFYEMMKKRLREDAGSLQLVVGSNWKTADARILGALERYTYTGADVVARNTYFGVDYKKGGRQKFYALERGDTFRAHSALKAPHKPTPPGTPQPANYPFMITENNWTRPNPYRAEWPLIVACYGSMLGIDGWTFFAKKATDWRHNIGVWDVSNPSVLGQFPAAALIYRRGDVQEAKRSVVRESVSLPRAYAMEGTAAVELRGKDALWQSRLGKEHSDRSGAGDVDVNPLAYFMGPVVQQFGDAPARVQIRDIQQFINRRSRTVRSITGELTWDARRGVMMVDTPFAQGAWGFLGEAGVICLGDVALDVKNNYGAVVAVSLDGKPLASSQKILIQAGTMDKPYGYETREVGKYRRITDLGGFPLNVRRIRAAVEIRTSSDNVIVLDGNGYPRERWAKKERKGSKLQLELPEDSLYTLCTSKEPPSRR